MRKLLFIVMLLLSAVLGTEAKTEKGRAIYNHPTWRKTTPPPHYGVVLENNEKMHDFIIDNIVFRLYSGADSVWVVPRYTKDTYDCSYKKNLIIPDSVFYNGKIYPVCGLGERIRYQLPYPFYTIESGYNQLDYVSLPKTVKHLLSYINSDTIDVPDMSFLESRRFYNYDKYGWLSYGWLSGSLGETVLCNKGDVVHDLQLPEGIKDIKLRYSVFRLRSITFPSSLKKLGQYFTFGNQYLERCIFKGGPDSLDGKFYIDSPNLKELVLPSTLRYVVEDGINVFLMNPAAVWPSTLGYVRGTYEQCCELLRSHPSYSWKDVWLVVDGAEKKYGELVIPEGVKSVGSWRDEGLIRIKLSSTVEDFGGYFGSNLTELIIPSDTHLKDFYGFCGKIRMKEFTVPNTVCKIGKNAFPYFDKVVLPANPDLVIGWAALEGVKNVVIPYGLTKISDGAFYGAAITTIDIPNSVTLIDWRSFRDCKNLTTVNMSDNVETIMRGAFLGTKVSEFRLPKSLKLLSRDAFERSVVTDIYVYGPPASIIEDDGYGPSRRWKLHVLPAYKKAYETAYYWKDFFSIETFEPVGIHAVKNENQVEEDWYDLQGCKQGSGARGISIIKTSDGKTKKVWRK